MKVRVYPYREKIGMGNIVWPGKWEMRGGRFPSNHPAAPGWKTSDVVVIEGKQYWDQFGRSPSLDAFRACGYWASCFPEGDGITWLPLRGQSDAEALADISRCFGWEATWDPTIKISQGTRP